MLTIISFLIFLASSVFGVALLFVALGDRTSVWDFNSVMWAIITVVSWFGSGLYLFGL